MVVRQPQLLLYLTPTLKAHWTGLKGVLRAPHEAMVVIVQMYPNLLVHSPSTLKVRLCSCVCVLLCCVCVYCVIGRCVYTHSRLPTLVHTNSQMKLETLQRALGMPPLRAAELATSDRVHSHSSVSTHVHADEARNTATCARHATFESSRVSHTSPQRPQIQH